MMQEANYDNTADHIVVMVDPDLEDLIPGFFEYRRNDIDSIDKALQNGDFETIRILGHGMKGAGGGYGFDRITEIGRAIETAAKLGERATIERYVAELAAYLDHVQVVYG
jgi:HPt (histidine-containing phosphotransfer) domain-containing protein